MLKEDKNLKDSNLNSGLVVKDSKISISYNKSNKLIAALYIVTDVLEQSEPLRNKLRTLGAEIISDIHSSPVDATSKITQVISFLDLACTVHLISEMNYGILKTEFMKLEQSIKEYSQLRSSWLEEFLVNPLSVAHDRSDNKPDMLKDMSKTYIGQKSFSRTSKIGTRIGVQKGSTLMQALSDKTSAFSYDNYTKTNSNNFDILKKQRRKEIIEIIGTNESGLTITDIKNIAKGHPTKSMSVISCSEKTLQRELVSMVQDGVLNKTGEKRWSKYFLSKSLHFV